MEARITIDQIRESLCGDRSEEADQVAEAAHQRVQSEEYDQQAMDYFLNIYMALAKFTDPPMAMRLTANLLDPDTVTRVRACLLQQALGI